MKQAALAVLVCTLVVSTNVMGQAGAYPPGNLHLATLQGDIETVRQHIEAGADLDQKDAWGSTPLIIAATFNRVEVARLLVEAGADLNLTNNDASTALHSAAFLGRKEIVQILLDAGANKFLRDRFGNTPWDSVTAPFEEVRDVYDTVARGLAPLGLRLDYAQLQELRPFIADMLQPRPEEWEAIGYTPRAGDDWPVSTPEAQGLDPDLVAELYLHAAALPRLHSLLVFKDGYLIAEDYFNEGSADEKALLQSVTKSYTSALVGIALQRGCLSSVDQKMLDFFPEFADQISDPRKKEITIRHLLQMRGGYPWEESDPAYWDALVYGSLVPMIVEFPLVNDPGAEFHYSNVTSHLLGVIVARACGTDLKSFAEENLFSPLGVEEGEWIRDRDGYYVGLAELRFTARDAARFGQLYLDDGAYEGKQLVPAEWIEASLQRYSEDVNSAGMESGAVGRYFRNVGYGYQWWSARARDFRFNLAWGHGGQFIILLDELDMVIVVTSDPFYQQHDDESWRHERSNLNLVGKFIVSLTPGG